MKEAEVKKNCITYREMKEIKRKNCIRYREMKEVKKLKKVSYLLKKVCVKDVAFNKKI